MFYSPAAASVTALEIPRITAHQRTYSLHAVVPFIAQTYQPRATRHYVRLQ